jgi:ribosomal protein L13E
MAGTATGEDLRDALLSLHRNLPIMEQHWNEVREMRERLEQKERLMSKTICESKSVLKMLAHEILESDAKVVMVRNDKGRKSPKAAMDSKPNMLPGGDCQEVDVDHSNDQKSQWKSESDNLSPDAMMLLVDPKITHIASPNASPSPIRTTPTSIAESITMVADEVMRESKDSSARRRDVIDSALKRAKADQDRICQEIVDGERELRLLESAMEERRQLIEDCEVEKGLLDEKRMALEKELEDLGSKFCEMNEALLGQSLEESRVFLQSIREETEVDPKKSPSVSVASRSPLLQKYVGVWNELKQSEGEMSGLVTRLVDLGAEDAVTRGQVCELREKLAHNRELNGDLLVSEEELLREAKECEGESHRLDFDVQAHRDDLLAAMRWGVSESGGLYRPTVSTAALVLLLFQQHCRQQVGFKPLSREELGENVTLGRLRRCGCVWSGLKRAGFTASEVRLAGLRLKDLQISDREAKEFHEAGYSLQEMKGGGISASALISFGYTASQLRQAGFTPRELLSSQPSAAFNELGYSLQEMKDDGVSVAILKSLGFSASQLNAAGYSLEELISGHYPRADLEHLGYTLQEMKQTGISAASLNRIGYTVSQLKEVGFRLADLRNLSNINRTEIANAGYSLQEMREAGVSAALLKPLGYSAAQLKEVGYSAGELASAGYHVLDLQEAGYSLQEMRDGRVSAASLKFIGYTASQLKEVGYSAADLGQCYSEQEVRNAGLSLIDIRQSGASAASLKSAGYTASQLKQGGYTVRDLLVAGYSLQDIQSAGYSLQEMKNGGATPRQLKEIGHTLASLKAVGYPARDILQGAKYSREEILRVFTLKEMKDGGCYPFTFPAFKSLGFSISQLKQAGFLVAQLCCPTNGYSRVPHLVPNNGDTGYSPKELHQCYSIKEMRESRIPARSLKSLGVSLRELKAAGYSSGDLVEAGFALEDIRRCR